MLLLDLNDWFYVDTIEGSVRENDHCNLPLQASSKYCLAKAPKLVEIMNAVPEEFKSILIPQ